MKVPKDHVVCGICREIIPERDSKQYVDSVEWGSFSGTPHYGVCCKTHPTDADGYLSDHPYA